MVEQVKRKIKISVDGGLNSARAAEAAKSGADEVVIGRAFYEEKDKRRMAEKIHMRTS